MIMQSFIYKTHGRDYPMDLNNMIIRNNTPNPLFINSKDILFYERPKIARNI